MYQLTYEREADLLRLQFPYKGTDYGFVTSLEGQGPFTPPSPGELVALTVRPTVWNQGLLRNHCKPLAMTPLASARLDAITAVRAGDSNVVDTDPTITDWTFYRTPFRHQVLSWKYAVDNPFSALFLQMGLGKTFTTVNVLDYFRKVKGVTKPSLVVIPLSSFESWEREFRLCGSDAKVVSVLGTRAKKIRLLNGEGDVFLITYESVRTLLDELMKRQWHYLVLDESTKIKNGNAERSKALYALRDKADRRIILTGYPITQSYVDLFGQYKFLDPGIFGTSFHRFRSRYCVMGGWNQKEVIGYANLKEMTDNMFKRCIRFTKSECLDLPEKNYLTYKFDLSEQERAAYDELKKQLIFKFSESAAVKQVAASNALVAGLRLVQICTGYVGGVEVHTKAHDTLAEQVSTSATMEDIDLDNRVVETLAGMAGFKELGSSKLEVLEEVLENVPADENVIIWCRFKHNLRQIEGLLKKIGWTHVLFSGALSGEERKAAISGFQEGRFRAFVGILQAGGHGLDLTRASYVVYYSQDYSIERRMQSEDRAHRIGQKRNVTYVDLVARRTIEESILTCLRGKAKEAEVLYEFQKDPVKFLEGGLA